MSRIRSRRSLYRDRRRRQRPRLVVSPGTRRVPLPGARSRSDPAPQRPAPRGRALHTGPEGRALRDRRYAAMSHRRSRRSLHRDPRGRDRPRLVVSPGTRRVPLPGARSRPDPAPRRPAPRGRALHTGPEGRALRDRRYAPMSHRRSRRSLYRDRRRRQRLVVSPGTRRVPLAGARSRPDPAQGRPAPRGRALHTGPEGRALRDRRYAAMSHRRPRRSLHRDPRGRDRPRHVVSPGTRRVPLPGARSRPIPPRDARPPGGGPSTPVRRVARCATGDTRRCHIADRVDRCTGIHEVVIAHASSYRRARDACPSPGLDRDQIPPKDARPPGGGPSTPVRRGCGLRDRRYAAMSHRRSRRSLYRDRRRRQRPRLVVSPGTRRVPLPGARSRPDPAPRRPAPRGRALHTGPEGLRVARPAIRGDVTSPIASIAAQGSTRS
jgi:hypothetical protein